MTVLLRQALRGMTCLPHVGSHPGTPILMLMVLAVITAGTASQRDAVYTVIAVVAVTLVFGSIVLGGAVSRAELSDRIEKRDALRKILALWAARPDPPDGRSWLRIGFGIDGDGPDVRLRVWVVGRHGPVDTIPEVVRAQCERILTGRTGIGPVRPLTTHVLPIGQVLIVDVEALSAHGRLHREAFLRDPEGTPITG